MKKKIRFSLFFLLLVFVIGKIFATPNTPTINSPANNAGYSFNRNPWIYFTATDGSGHQINDAQIQVATDSGF